MSLMSVDSRKRSCFIPIIIEMNESRTSSFYKRQGLSNVINVSLQIEVFLQLNVKYQFWIILVGTPNSMICQLYCYKAMNIKD